MVTKCTEKIVPGVRKPQEGFNQPNNGPGREMESFARIYVDGTGDINVTLNKCLVDVRYP